MDEPLAFEVGVAVDLPRAALRLTLKVTRVALGLVTLSVVGLLLHGDARVAGEAVLCSILACSPRPVAVGRRTLG